MIIIPNGNTIRFDDTGVNKKFILFRKQVYFSLYLCYNIEKCKNVASRYKIRFDSDINYLSNTDMKCVRVLRSPIFSLQKLPTREHP